MLLIVLSRDLSDRNFISKEKIKRISAVLEPERIINIKEMIIKQMLTTEEKYFFQFKTSMDAAKAIVLPVNEGVPYLLSNLGKIFVPKNTDIKGRMRINALMHILAKVTAQNLF